MDEVFQQLERLRSTEPRLVMATVVAAHGSTPRRPGARTFFGGGGRLVGPTVFGGAAESTIARESDAVLDGGTPRLLHLTVTEADAWQVGLTGAGSVDILLEPVQFGAADPVVEAFDRAREEVSGGRPVVMVAPMDGRAGRLVVYGSGNTAGSLGDPASDEAARVHAMALLPAGQSEVAQLEVGRAVLPLWFERLAPLPALIIYGASPVGEALLAMARRFGMRTIVVEGRERFSRRELLASAAEVMPASTPHLTDRLPAGNAVSLVLATHDSRHELPMLEDMLRRDVGYVAVLGTRRRGTMLREALQEAGVPDAQLARLHVPAAYESTSQGAPEIALAVIAEILAAQRGRSAAAAHG